MCLKEIRYLSFTDPPLPCLTPVLPSLSPPPPLYRDIWLWGIGAARTSRRARSPPPPPLRRHYTAGRRPEQGGRCESGPGTRAPPLPLTVDSIGDDPYHLYSCCPFHLPTPFSLKGNFVFWVTCHIDYWSHARSSPVPEKGGTLVPSSSSIDGTSGNAWTDAVPHHTLCFLWFCP